MRFQYLQNDSPVTKIQKSKKAITGASRRFKTGAKLQKNTQDSDLSKETLADICNGDAFQVKTSNFIITLKISIEGNGIKQPSRGRLRQENLQQD